MINIIFLLISIVTTLIVSPFIFKMLLKNGSVALNYREETIPVGMGLLFVLVQSILMFTSTIYLIGIDQSIILSYIICIILIGLIGMIDDFIGEEDIKGFKGHIKSLFKGRLTTGGLKAVVGLLLAIIFSVFLSNNLIEMIVNVLLVTLFTNIINLFDLRPGRSNKVFLLLSTVLIITANIIDYNFIIYSAMGIILVYIRYDLKAKSMMGDVGSNALGMTLGTFCVLTQTLNLKLIYLIILIVLHIISEFSSFSKIIKNNKFLNYLDNIGR